MRNYLITFSEPHAGDGNHLRTTTIMAADREAATALFLMNAYRHKSMCFRPRVTQVKDLDGNTSLWPHWRVEFLHEGERCVQKIHAPREEAALEYVFTKWTVATVELIRINQVDG